MTLLRLFKKSAFDHEGGHEAYSTSNMKRKRNFRCSRSFHYAPLLSFYLHSIFSVLKTELFELALIVKIAHPARVFTENLIRN